MERGALCASGTRLTPTEAERRPLKKICYPPKGGLLPKCAVIFPAPAAFADGGYKTPTPLRQNPFPALWGWISV